MVSVSGEHQEAKENLRSRLYTQLYGYDSYEWVSKDSGSSTSADPGSIRNFTPESPMGDNDHEPSGSAVSPAVPTKQLTHKPYVPPTQFDPATGRPFGKVLDGPLN